MDEINYRATATLMLRNAPDASGIARGGPIWSGTLSGAVMRAMELTPAERARATIMVGDEAGTGKSLLDRDDFEALYNRPDFPR